MKKWLGDNKVYIELVSSVLFGLAAILVAIASYTVSKQQLLVSKAAIQPHFFVNEAYIYDAEKKYSSVSEYEIFNAGAPVYNLNISLKSFFRIEHDGRDARVVTIIPIVGYYPGQFIAQSPIGKITTFKGAENNEKFVEIYRQFLSDEVKNIYGFVEMSVFHITVVKYHDKNGEAGVVFFRDREVVSEDSVSDFIEIHKSVTPAELFKLDAEAIMKRVSELGNHT